MNDSVGGFRLKVDAAAVIVRLTLITSGAATPVAVTVTDEA
jgi:hypothetical protein